MNSRFYIQDEYVYAELGEDIKLIGDFYELLKLNKIEFDLQTVQTSNFENEKVIKLVPEKNLCRVCLSDDNLYAWLSIFPIFPSKLTAEDILDQLSKHQVTTGIDRALISEIIEKAEPIEELVIARGIAPVPGSPQIIVNHYHPTDKIEFKVDEDGNVDYKNLDNIINIKTGTVLATRIREREPEPGMDIFGKTIEPPPLINIDFDVGKGIFVVGDEAIAYMDGYLELDNRGRLSINNTMIINGDVAYGTGNLNVDGNILIKGDILPGFSVKSSRNIDILGSAEDASIHAGGDITIRGAVVGKKGCDIEAGGDISVYYAQNSTLKSRGSIHVKRYVYNSSLMSGDMIFINSREGVLLGDANMVSAKNAISIKSILQDKPLDINVTGFSYAEYSELLIKVENDITEKLETIRELGTKKAGLLAGNGSDKNNNELFELLKLEQSFSEELNGLNRLKRRFTHIVKRVPQPGIVEIDRSSCLKLTVTIGNRSTTVPPFVTRVKFVSDDEKQSLVML